MKNYCASCDTWNEMINFISSSKQAQDMFKFLQEEKKTKVVYPQANEVFNAYKLTPYDKVSVVIIGQDPYTDGSAHGLAFSSRTSYRPPSLRTIFEEITDDYYQGFTLQEAFKKNNNLTPWALDGVLLLNRALTVVKGNPGSHEKIGWDLFITETIELLNQKEKPVIYLLWGSKAQALKSIINVHDDYILQAVHPAAHFHNPNVSFKGCRHFTKTNWLINEIHKKMRRPIGWAIP